jgi:hypothetical protein
MSVPEVNLIWGNYNKNQNMQSWGTAIKDNRNAYTFKAIYWAKIIKSNGWSLNGVWKWNVDFVKFHLGTGTDKDETWGNYKEKRKLGGYVYADEVDELKMIFTAKAEFEKDGVVKEFGWQREIMGIDDAITGKAIESTTLSLNDDEEEDDIEPDPEPEPEPEPDDTDTQEVEVDEKLTIGEWINKTIAWFKSKWWIWILVAVLLFILHIVRC